MGSIDFSPWLVGYTAFIIALMFLLIFINARANKQDSAELPEEENHFINLNGERE